MLKGSRIQESSSAVHLGTRIGANNSKANIQKAVSERILSCQSLVIVLAQFLTSFLNLIVLLFWFPIVVRI